MYINNNIRIINVLNQVYEHASLRFLHLKNSKRFLFFSFLFFYYVSNIIKFRHVQLNSILVKMDRIALLKDLFKANLITISIHHFFCCCFFVLLCFRFCRLFLRKQIKIPITITCLLPSFFFFLSHFVCWMSFNHLSTI